MSRLARSPGSRSTERPEDASVAWTLEPSGAVPERAVPHVVAWNLTRRCNLACAHCYIAAGSWHAAEGELTTDDCFRVIDEILAVNPAPMLILSGGEPLIRTDLETIAERATAGGATVVIGTNGTRLSDERIGSLAAAGVRGVAVSIDSLDPDYHDRFRHGAGSLGETRAAVDRLGRARLDFVVQTTVTGGNRHEIPALAAWSAERGAVAFNVYFLVPTGRGSGMRGLDPDENEAVLTELVELERIYRGRMLVRAKCQPAFMRRVYEGGGDSPVLHYATRCPCGVHYCRITPEGKVTPCPYTPVVAGDLAGESFGDIWRTSPVFRRLRSGSLGGKCGRCGYREVCGGCRARAYAVHGDLMGPDDACAYEPDGIEDPVERRRETLYGSPADDGAAGPEGRPPRWTPAARDRFARVPSFVRGVVTSRVERYAAERGYEEITEAVIDEVRERMPVDFSKRRPFFMNEHWNDGGERP